MGELESKSSSYVGPGYMTVEQAEGEQIHPSFRIYRNVNRVSYRSEGITSRSSNRTSPSVRSSLITVPHVLFAAYITIIIWVMSGYISSQFLGNWDG